jgi:FMN phosphatase YigB (HAD superfamily)
MPVELVRLELSQAGLQIPREHLLTSTLVGHRKPHQAGFRTLADRLGVACHSLLYVGNEPKDIGGGKAAGCRTALVWRDSCKPPEWGQDATIESLDELRELLRK